MDDSLKIQVERPEAGSAVVVFKGEHDVTQVEALRECLSALVAENEVVVADFSGAQFVDSSIIHLLIETKRGADACQRRFRLQMGTECVVYRVFEVAEVLSFLECVPSREEALAENGDL